MFNARSLRLTSPAVLLVFISILYSITGTAAPAAKVDFVVGNVTAVGADGQSRALIKGAEINAGDTINTGSGRTQLRFSDGGKMSLAPETEFGVDEYNYEGKTDGSEKSFFRLVKGGLRAITGTIGRVNKRNYQVNTPTATIGIRGTEFLATMQGKLLVRVGDGAVFISNGFGDLVLYKGQSGSVESGQKPQYSNEQPIIGSAGSQGVKDESYILGEDVAPNGDPCAVVGGCLQTVAFDNVGVAWAAFHSEDGEGPYWTEGDSPNVNIPGGSVVSTQIVADNKGVLRSQGTTYSESWADEPLPDVTRDSFGSTGNLAWSRWVGGHVRSTGTDLYGSYDDTDPLAAAHFIWGEPTSIADMVALQNGNYYATYSVVGGTIPTKSDAYTGATTSLVGGVSGIMSVHFGYGSVSLSNWNAGGYNLGSASGLVGSNSSAFSSVYCNCASDLSFSGFFAGSMAGQAGVSYSYKAPDSSYVIQGAAALNQTSLSISLPQ